ncbi:MAG TPA: Stk1 family PASTA domain-containing Ser/Thr kinase [Gaiellaceae bacterium]|nr:Stk1 family PASTA domain-containing Ser/Thr kinase [Gaiellaceae bacterium]
MAVSDTLIGTVFDGRYRIVRKLGTGGMADVYLAEDQELGRRVAIKILNDRHAADDQFVERFRREAKNAAGLSHPNIVSVYDRGTAEGTYYIAMEYLDGRSLKELIVSRGPAPVKTAVEYARQILAAVGFAHRHGIVHRDIKPHNVLVAGDEGRLKVTDFGIARSGASQMTEVGSIIGTAQYLSPEQARGAPVDQTSDLYAVGVVLYELLTGQVPFTGDTPLEIAMKHLSEVPKPPSELRPEVPHDLDLVVLRALAKDPADRYQTAEEMDADLDRVLKGLPVGAETAEAATAVLSGAGVMAAAPTSVIRRPTTPIRPAPPGATPPAGYYGYEGPPRRRRPIWPWILAVLLLIAAGAAAWFAYTKIQNQLNSSKTVPVPNVVPLEESLAVQKIHNANLVPQVIRVNSDSTKQGLVIDQTPDPGTHVAKNTTVTIHVSKGPPQVPVPDVVGKSQADAVSALTAAGLKANVHSVHSSKPPDTVTAQDPQAGTKVLKGSRVRINISSGPQPVSVPYVVGLSFDQASAQLQSAGFAVARKNVDSNQPKDTVVAEQPTGTAAPGATITLSVSRGPKQSTVPDVTNQDQQSATSTLQAAGFKVNVVKQDVQDPGLDGIVLSQTPTGGTKAPQGSTVTITVGQLSQSGQNGQ